MTFSTLHRILLVLATVLIGGLIGPNLLVADEAVPGVEQLNPEGRTTAPAPMVKATIVKKKHHWVITDTGDRYLVKHGTLIVDPNRRQIKLRELRVPCRARIVFEMDQQVRKAHRIRVLRTSAEARTDFTRDMPE